MVLFFSTTGNTEYIAKKIADSLNDTALDLFPRIRENDYSEIHSDAPFVICLPVYVCRIPDFVENYLKRTELTGNRNAYFVFTSGGYAGISGPVGRKIVRKKGLRYKGCAELIMPQNYIATNLYDELEDSEIRRRISESSRTIEPITETIRKGGRLKSRHKWLIEYATVIPVSRFWQRYMQPVRKFYATDKCTGCGLCAKRCPLKRITMAQKYRDGASVQRPEWTGRRCAHCMSCIQNCPVQAIEYGKITPGKKRYRLRDYQRVHDRSGQGSMESDNS